MLLWGKALALDARKGNLLTANVKPKLRAVTNLGKGLTFAGIPSVLPLTIWPMPEKNWSTTRWNGLTSAASHVVIKTERIRLLRTAANPCRRTPAEHSAGTGACGWRMVGHGKRLDRRVR
jgi:hypothetical protein